MPDTPEQHDQDPDTGRPGGGTDSKGGPADGPAGGPAAGAVDDVKARMRAALDRKQQNDRGVIGGGHKRGGKVPETHGPLGGVHMHRRKAGGGGGRPPPPLGGGGGGGQRGGPRAWGPPPPGGGAGPPP